MQSLIYIILIFIVVFFVRKFISKFKFPKVGSIAVFTGGVKVGKSAVSLACALSNYRRVRRRYRIKCFFIKVINLFKKKKKEFPEEPFFYSSIPLKRINYVPLTREHLLREKRLRYGSVVFIDEASLVADSQLIKNKDINAQLLLFFKLFGHECGGTLVINSHCLGDLHYAIKRCTSQYFYVHSISRWIPFVCACSVREERYSEDNTTLNVYADDVENTTRRCLMRKSTFKRYDCYCFSYLTDNLPVDSKEDLVYKGKGDSLKADEIVSFRPEFFELTKRSDIENEKKEC